MVMWFFTLWWQFFAAMGYIFSIPFMFFHFRVILALKIKGTKVVDCIAVFFLWDKDYYRLWGKVGAERTEVPAAVSGD